MRTIWWNIQKQEPVLKLILISGMACAIYCMFRKWTAVCLALIIATTVAAAVYAKLAQRYAMKQYGILYYQMPDGEIVEENIQNLYREFDTEKRCRLIGRPVSLRCVYRGVSPWNTVETGYGMTIMLEEQELIEKMKHIQKGQIVSFSGELTLSSDQELTLTNITQIHIN